MINRHEGALVRITTSAGNMLDISPALIVKVTVDEDLNKFGAHAAIAFAGGGGIYLKKAEYDRVNQENDDILVTKG